MARGRPPLDKPTPVRGADSASSANQSAIATRISAHLGTLAGGLVTTATATYGRMGLGFVEAKVLGALGEGPATGAQISRCLGVDPAAISRAAHTLIGRDLIFRSGGASPRLCLTESGRAALQPVNLIAETRAERLLVGLSANECADLLGYLERLLQNLPALSLLAKEWRAPADQP